MKRRQELISELQKHWNVNYFNFEGEYAVKKNGKAYFRNIKNPKDKSRLYFPNRERLTVTCPPQLKLEEGSLYKINLFVPKDEVLEKSCQDYLLFLDFKNRPPRLIELRPKEYIHSIQQEYNSARGIALEALSGAMDRLVGDVSRKPETFIYELLQNADDYPDHEKGKVKVKFSVIDDYLVFQHTGLPFKANNVRAICNVNAGDKGDDLEKIGYKGMGFKSIFNHSNYVIINSGGFCFRFDEEYHLSKGNETFWSLIPIWTDELPSSLTDFQSQDYTVSIFIRAKEGNEKLKSYYNTLEKIFNDERLLLFLRWVEKVEIKGFEGDFVRIRDSASWEISDLEAIEVPQEQRDILNHRIRVERTKVPEKYKDIQQVKIAFASKLSNGKMLQTDNAKIYAYLPTELNFGFPFLLNADFIPDGNRSYLHPDLEWNLFLFYNTGKELLKWIDKLWIKYQDASVYLMIPTDEELSSNQEDDERELFLSEFKRGIADGKSDISFISGLDNLTYSSDEIIIDKTGLFSNEIIDTSFFYSISDSSKKFINNGIDVKRLNDTNLDIESFSLSDFIERIEEEENLELLSQYVNGLAQNKKIEWLKWVNAKVKDAKFKLGFVINLPIIFSKDSVLSVKDAFEKNDFIIALNSFKKLTLPLEQIGFVFSDNLLDSTSNILDFISSDSNYLGDERKLFERLTNNQRLVELSPDNKNELFLFFESLEEVADRTLEKVEIFKNQLDDNPKSLSELITSNLESFPNWLRGFIIDADEENALSSNFKKLLVTEDEIFEKIFSKEHILSSICSMLKDSEIVEFYQFISRTFDALPEGHGIKFKDLAWLYSVSDNAFHKSEYFYAPSGLNKASKSKYREFAFVIESKSKMKTLTYEANEFKKKLSLGALEGDFADIIMLGSTFSLPESLTLLDFLVANGESDFFEKFRIESVGNEYVIKQSLGILNYYTTDKKLIEYIVLKETNLELLSSNLYDADLSKIGLLENKHLLGYLIENKFVDNSLVQFVYSFKEDVDLCKKYLNELKEIKIEAKLVYNNKSDEFRIFELITHLDVFELNEFRSRIYIDDENLNSEARSGDIWFNIDGKNKRIELSLSEIVAKSENKTYSRDAFIDKFKVGNNEAHSSQLKNLFDAKNFSSTEIKDKLLASVESPLNAKQLIFFHFYFLENGKSDILSGKLSFLDLYQSDQIQYAIEARAFLDQCLVENIATPFEFFQLPDFNPSEKIWEDDYAINSEKVPSWLREYVGEDTLKLELLVNVGLNTSESHVIKFRKALKERNVDEIDTHRSSLSILHLSNTIRWIQEISLSLQKDTLKSIYDKLQRDGIAINTLLIPLSIGNTISFCEWNEGQVFHLKHTGWGEYASAIESAIIYKGQYVIDDTLNEFYQAQLEVVSDDLSTDLDEDKINSEGTLFDANYYKSWGEIEKLTIKIYSSDFLPRISKYGDLIQFSEEENFKVRKMDNYYIVAKSLERAIPECILQTYEDPYLEKLKTHKERYIRENESDEISKLALSKGLELDQRIATNSEAKKVAIQWLESNGYDCSDVVTDFDRLCNIIKDGERTEAIVNSISAGVVYIRPENWLKLKKENTILLLVNKTEVTKLDSISDIIMRYPKTLIRVDNSVDVEKHLAAIAEETSRTATTQFVFFDEELNNPAVSYT